MLPLRRSIRLALGGTMVLAGAAGCGSLPRAPEASAATHRLPADSAVRAMLRAFVDSGKTPGIVVGIFDAGRARFVSHGTDGPPDPTAIDENTLFEIGSLTKVFTATVLADMVQRAEVRLDDPVAKHLPPRTRVPSRAGRQITLLDLATHASGLPRLPRNLAVRDFTNPYAEYTSDKLYAFLATYELPRAIGETFEYSNLGFGLLGHALTLGAGTDYETLVRTRVLQPLGMLRTRIALTSADSASFASGHNALGAFVPAWTFASLAGAGALRSSAADMIRFLAANIRARADSSDRRGLAPAMRLTHEPRRPVAPGTQIGLGWLSINRPNGRTIFVHDGGTGGYRSFAAFDPARRVAVIVLSASLVDVGNIGLRLIDN